MSLVVIVRNVSELAPVSDYEYVVRVGDGTAQGSAEIAAGRVTAHTRADGWKALIQRVLDAS
jgi:hypothetical protein